ncbi:MAG TPA: FG-GAP-like repeat-containing protein, partial [Bryobacteraceae bacterium]|nr:FG-GAP-like repeat-containing protein [Bryobacteraceae bacterium]
MHRLALFMFLSSILSAQGIEARLWHYRNLGKAFYENPTTQTQAVGEFKKALDLAPTSIREQVNYGLALLRAGDTAHGIAELRKVQKQDPKLPYTWFNLGIALKKEGDLDGALAHFLRMQELVPDLAVDAYQVGAILKAKGDTEGAVKAFEKARDLDPRLAAPHFQLYGLYRQTNRPQEATQELLLFQQRKKADEGAAVPEDLEWSFYSEIYDPVNSPPAAPAPPPVYRAARLADGVSGFTAISLGAGSRASLIAWSKDRTTLFRDGKTPVLDSGLEALRDVVFIAAGDFDNDGLTDLCIVTTQGATLYKNINGKFRKHADLATGSFRQAVWLDFDHDYDLDILLIGDHPKLLRNNGAAGFGDETRRFPFVPGRALNLVRFDLEPDTPGFDLVMSYEDRPGVLYRDLLGGNYRAQDVKELPAGAMSLVAYDFNHDGRTDLAAMPDLLLLNRPTGFEKDGAPPSLGRADFEGNGRLTLVSIAPDGALMLDRDVTPNYGNWMEIALTGVKNLKSAIGAKVEVKAGTLYAKQTYDGVPLVFRLGGQQTAETVRITWPNGLIQNELNQPINKILAIKEAPRLSGSCPMIFTWDGEQFSFITDVLGVAPLGASSGDGQFFPVDHQEYVAIPSGKLKPRDGVYEVRVTEELREVSYLDQIQLQAVDHPASIDILTNDKFKSPPFPEFRLFGVDRRIYPVAARDQNGKDVLAAVLKRDSTYPDSFRRDPAGVAELHNLDLDFGNAAASNRAILVLDGWVDWADGSTFLSATQQHQDLTFPYLQVKDSAGNWKTVIEDMGMPSGKPKPMVVDLTGKFLSASREVRIITNLSLYWDEIYLVENNDPPPNKLTVAPLLSADLHFRGFSKVTIHPERKQPEKFDYSAVSDTTMWNPTPGLYTRYGDVTPLLTTVDDRLMIMGSGDEVTLRFRAADLPPLPQGWKRDFLLLVDGWAKDADANTAFSQSVLPLPFHGM